MITKEEQRLRELGSKFRDLHLIVSVHDWSAMFAQDGEE